MSFYNVNNSSRDKPFQVVDITRLIKSRLESSFAGIWIEGEISNFKRVASGHCYFTLKDDSSQIQAVMFRSQAEKYISDDIDSGIKVRVMGSVSVYERSGNYQIICQRLERVGLGDLQVKFLRLKEELNKKGWFDPALKKDIPLISERIAVVTSRTGAAVRDMLNIIYSRMPGQSVLVVPVRVQGEEAAGEIAAAIRILNKKKLCDLMIIGRGGGSLEDLWAFNELVVAEAVYESEIPVISAVGHEIDFTISDFVADFRAETPSAAAVKATPLMSDLIYTLKSAKERMHSLVSSQIELYRQRLLSYRNHYCFREPLAKVREMMQRLDDIEERLKKSMYNNLSRKREKVLSCSNLLVSLSPFNVLKRGYSITLDSEGRALTTTTDVKAGDKLNTILSVGKISAEVLSVKEGDIK